MKIFTIIFALLFLAGCYEDTDVTMHEPGIYKGKIDQHDLTVQEREAVLKKHFLHVQTDR